jgi:predicted component of type VI protein secretion system
MRTFPKPSERFRSLRSFETAELGMGEVLGDPGRDCQIRILLSLTTATRLISR